MALTFLFEVNFSYHAFVLSNNVDACMTPITYFNRYAYSEILVSLNLYEGVLSVCLSVCHKITLKAKCSIILSGNFTLSHVILPIELLLF